MKKDILSSFEVVKIKLKKLVYLSVCLLFIFLITACTKKIDNKAGNNDPITIKPITEVKEVNLKRTLFNYKLSDTLPNSYTNFLKNDAVISEGSNYNLQDYKYSDTPLANHINNILFEYEALFNELQTFYNDIIKNVVFYSDNTYKINNLNNGLNIEINNIEYNGYYILTNLDLKIKGNAKDLNLSEYLFEGDFTLTFNSKINDDFYQDITITLMPDNEKYKGDDITGVTIKLSEKESFEVSMYKNYMQDNKEIEISSNIALSILDNKYNRVKGYYSIKKDSVISNNIFYMYANDIEGTIYNKQLNYNNDKLINEHEDVEVFEEQLLYKSLSSKIVNQDGSFSYENFVGWPFVNIENFNYTPKDIFSECNINYGTKIKLVNEIGKAGLTQKEINIYNDSSYPLFGYFVLTEKNTPSIFKYVFNISNDEYQEFNIKTDIQLKVMSNVLNIYRLMLIESGVDINYNERLEILDENINKEFTNKNIIINSGYDENQSYLINIYKNGSITDYIYLEGLFYHLTDIIYDNNKYIAFGQKEGKPFVLIFEVNSEGKITKNNIYKYSYRRQGLLTSGSYDSDCNEYQFTMNLTDDTTHTLSIQIDKQMLPIVRKHISMNHSHGTYITPKYIVIHETAVLENNTDGLYWFNTWDNPGRSASTQFVVDDTTVFQLMDVNEKAWHVGDNRKNDDGSYYSDIFNSNSIGMEICVNKDGDYFEARQNAITLTVYLLKEFNLTPDRVVRHKDASGKNCPATMIRYPELWEDFVNQVTEAYNNID